MLWTLWTGFRDTPDRVVTVSKSFGHFSGLEWGDGGAAVGDDFEDSRHSQPAPVDIFRQGEECRFCVVAVGVGGQPEGVEVAADAYEFGVVGAGFSMVGEVGFVDAGEPEFTVSVPAAGVGSFEVDAVFVADGEYPHVVDV